MLRVIFYSVGIFRTSSLGDSILSNPERTATRSQGEEPVYIEVLQQRAGSLNIKRLLLIRENQISQVKEVNGFSKDTRIWAPWSHSFCKVNVEKNRGSQAVRQRKGKCIRGKREDDWPLRRTSILPFWQGLLYTPPMKNYLKGWLMISL